MSEYPSILRAIRNLRLAPKGQKTARRRALVKARTASLRRELARK